MNCKIDIIAIKGGRLSGCPPFQSLKNVNWAIYIKNCTTCIKYNTKWLKRLTNQSISDNLISWSLEKIYKFLSAIYKYILNFIK